MSRAHDLAWAAGFFDGEGYITIHKKVIKPKKETHKEYTNHRLRIGLNHVAPEPVYELVRIFGGYVYHEKITERKNSDGFNRKDRYAWILCDDKAKEVLVQLLPYLRNKNKVAALGIELRNTFTQLGGGSVSQEVLDKRDELRIQIATLNSRD